ncbi:hypothetical protein [Piscirickettsia litoralis]|uniref:DUF1640 domain-containing protein n=1 Tax=Piscirickettsia litoralis TaxID=1891921 RepID=A0ABX2ZX28_9GAMM|nr:hypothetical protein [Piscirickettsia litoralis]ODN41102.1 hypothetical protein BGC07_18325 [Piscirickettsia litoralis]
MNSEEITTDLFKKIVEGSTVTKAEMIEAIHANNKDIRDEMQSLRSDIKWGVGIIISVVTIVVAIASYLTHLT